MAAFERGSHYAINILAADQHALAVRFAAKDVDRFDGVAFRLGASGVPLLDGAAAVFECFNRSRYEEGDHVIFVGEVERCERRDGAPSADLPRRALLHRAAALVAHASVEACLRGRGRVAGRRADALARRRRTRCSIRSPIRSSRRPAAAPARRRSALRTAKPSAGSRRTRAPSAARPAGSRACAPSRTPIATTPATRRRRSARCAATRPWRRARSGSRRSAASSISKAASPIPTQAMRAEAVVKALGRCRTGDSGARPSRRARALRRRRFGEPAEVGAHSLVGRQRRPRRRMAEARRARRR